MNENEQTTIGVSKSVHRELSYAKLDKQYDSFEDMLVAEILE